MAAAALNLAAAAAVGNAPAVQLLLAAGAAVDAVDPVGYTALQHASLNGHSEVVQILLTAGATVDAHDAHGWTALHRASEQGHAEVVQLLLSAHASVNAVVDGGYTALHLAAQFNHAALVQLLLAAQAEVNPVTTHASRFTPVYLAAVAGSTEAVQALLAAPQLSTDAMSQATRAAAQAGHAELSMIVLKALMDRDIHAAAAVLITDAVAAEVMGRCQVARCAKEAQRPAIEELVVRIALTHQQVQAEAAGIRASAVRAAVQAAQQVVGEAAGDAAVLAAASSAAASAASAAVAPLAGATSCKAMNHQVGVLQADPIAAQSSPSSSSSLILGKVLRRSATSLKSNSNFTQPTHYSAFTRVMLLTAAVLVVSVLFALVSAANGSLGHTWPALLLLPSVPLSCLPMLVLSHQPRSYFGSVVNLLGCVGLPVAAFGAVLSY